MNRIFESRSGVRNRRPGLPATARTAPTGGVLEVTGFKAITHPSSYTPDEAAGQDAVLMHCVGRAPPQHLRHIGRVPRNFLFDRPSRYQPAAPPRLLLCFTSHKRHVSLGSGDTALADPSSISNSAKRPTRCAVALTLIEQAILGRSGFHSASGFSYSIYSMTIRADGSIFADLGTRFREAP
jgi:hypothetical protein